MARIFLSATSKDLIDYRKAADQVLRELGHEVITMEYLTASVKPPLKKCLDEVASCSLYVGIIAWRYGDVPKDPVLNPREESITALEYRKAREQGIGTLLFLVEENTPWSPQLQDATKAADHGARINAFRDELKRDLVVSFFSSPDELARKVSTAVTQWEREHTPTTVATPVEGERGEDLSDASISWGLVATGAAKSAYTGEGVTVAVLDTGVQNDHEAFAGVEFETRDFTGEGDGDDHGHGTMMAATVFGRPVGGRRIGVAPGVRRALIAKVLSRAGGGTSKVVTDGILWALDRGAQIIVCELGIDFPGYLESLIQNGLPARVAASKMIDAYRYNQELFESVAELSSRSCLLIAAGGNESQRHQNDQFVCAPSLPGAARGFLSVGAVGRAKDNAFFDVAPFSNAGVDVVAPGVDVSTAKRDGGITTVSGTTSAASHAAGIAALWAQQIMNARGSLSINELNARLRGSASLARLRRGIGPDDVGCGLVQAPQRNQ